MQACEHGSDRQGSITPKRRHTTNRRRRSHLFDDDDMDDSSDEGDLMDFTGMPKRQSRRQRGLAPEIAFDEATTY